MKEKVDLFSTYKVLRRIGQSVLFQARVDGCSSEAGDGKESMLAGGDHDGTRREEIDGVEWDEVVRPL